MRYYSSLTLKQKGNINKVLSNCILGISLELPEGLQRALRLSIDIDKLLFIDKYINDRLSKKMVLTNYGWMPENHLDIYKGCKEELTKI